MISRERLDYLGNYVAKDPQVKELLNYYKEKILSHAHRPVIVTGYGISSDPNGIDSIRDMAVLEFITGILNYNQGEQNDDREFTISTADPE